ncbi:F-box protein At3g07870-like isoform X1 [Lolium rigidum]|uniref:F-box protein At3g07870-like isoform X1 n=1 Tax=Lolium rigidum TaxID=89674 RepID=UPI001F5CA37B|nr:F-box protein At3g07870-like isoform X1 [Lolium rigidum]
MVTEEAKSKKQISDECIINRLPGDLIERIFLRLPVSTLLSCIGVCKHWHDFIRGPQFVTSHLQDAPRYAFLFFPQGLVSGEPYPSDAILIDEAWSPSTYAVPVIGPDDLLFGTCNGLLGLYTKTSTIKIANFTTGEYMHLKKPAKNMRGDHFSFYSFGFHPVTKEYKITHFLGDCIEGRPSNKHKFSFIEVYTLGDKKWKDIPTPEPLSLNSVRNSGVVNVDGTMYWLTEDKTASWQHTLVSFDLREENFAMIQLPVEREDDDYFGPRMFWIRDIGGKLCIVTAQTGRYDARILVGELQIWTLDNPVEQRWSQKHNIKNPPNYIPGPHFVHMDRILAQSFFSVDSFELISENTEVSCSKVATLFDFSPRKLYNMQSYICVKSLVCLDVYKKGGIVCRPKQEVGWKLKKWEVWENELREAENMRREIQKLDHNFSEVTEKIIKLYQVLVDSTHAISERVRMELDHVLQHKPENRNQPRFLRRLNWVERKRDKDELTLRSNKINDRMQAIHQAQKNISSIVRSYMPDQGISIPGVSSTADKNQ